MRKNILLITILIIVLVLAACSSKEAPANTEKPVEVTNPEQVPETPVDQASNPPQEQTASEKLLSDFYRKMMEDGKYTMKYKTFMREGGSEGEMEVTLAVMGEMTAMIMDSDDFESMIINKEDAVYMVDHESKTIMVFPQSLPVAEGTDTASPEDLSDYEMNYVGSGFEVFMGKERKYEEYAFEGGSSKYYFDGDDLDGMLIRMGEQTTIMDIEEISDTVDESLFELPSGYQEIKMGM